jgi:hypothetical protein
MAGLRQLEAELVRDGRISDNEVAVIRDAIAADGRLDLDDVKFLVELLGGAREVCGAFDDLFFPALKEVLLADGRIGLDEQYYLLKMLYSDGNIRPREMQFLEELRREADETPPEFEALYREACAAHPTMWSVGGH